MPCLHQGLPRGGGEVRNYPSIAINPRSLNRDFVTVIEDETYLVIIYPEGGVYTELFKEGKNFEQTYEEVSD